MGLGSLHYLLSPLLQLSLDLSCHLAALSPVSCVLQPGMHAHPNLAGTTYQADDRPGGRAAAVPLTSISLLHSCLASCPCCAWQLRRRSLATSLTTPGPMLYSSRTCPTTSGVTTSLSS